MKNNVIYILIMLITVILSGCAEQTDQFIKNPYIPRISVGDKPITDDEKIVGTWEISKEYDSKKIYVRYIFNSDKTGTYETTLEGKHYFKYEIGSFPIITGIEGEIFRTEEECKVRYRIQNSDIDITSTFCTLHTKFIRMYDWKPSTSLFGLSKILDYEFIDNNNLMIENAVILERKFI